MLLTTINAFIIGKHITLHWTQPKGQACGESCPDRASEIIRHLNSDKKEFWCNDYFLCRIRAYCTCTCKRIKIMQTYCLLYIICTCTWFELSLLASFLCYNAKILFCFFKERHMFFLNALYNRITCIWILIFWHLHSFNKEFAKSRVCTLTKVVVFSYYNSTGPLKATCFQNKKKHCKILYWTCTAPVVNKGR